MAKPESHKSYRPLTVLTFRANAEMAGITPFTFHLTNVLLHVIVCALFYEFSLKIFQKQTIPAALASFVFLAHPVHTEAVANIVGRAEVLAGLFYLLCLVKYYNVVSKSLRR